MHWIDILVIGLLLISGAFAYARGFVHEVLSIGGWIGAVFATMYATPAVEQFTVQFIQDPFIATLVTGIVIFIGALVILSIITRRISNGVKESALGPLDRALGFLFGILRGGVIVALVWIGYEWMTPPDEQPKWIYEARTIPMIVQGANMLKALAPPSDKDAKKAPGDPSAKSPQKGPSLKEQSKTLLDKAINAVPQAPDGSKTDGYGKKERTEMDRLFETSQ
jgi:membrane protein required for colicin V production